MQFASPPPIDTTKLLAIIIGIIFLAIIVSINTGCNIQKRIEAAKVEAVRADRAEHPCANDTIYRLVPGEQLVLIDTVHHHTTDTLFNWTYDTAVVTRTIRVVDTVKAFIRDNYKIDALTDSINRHNQIEANLNGQLIQEKLNTLTEQKTAKNRLAIIIAIFSFITILLGVGVYFKFFSASGTLKTLLK